MRSFPLIRSTKPTVIMGLLMVLPLVLMALNPVYQLFIPPAVLLYLPVLLCISGLWAGSAAAIAGLAAGIGTCLYAFGGMGGAMAALYLLPFTAAFVIVVEKRVSFFKAALIMGLTLLLSQLAAFVILNAQTGHKLYQAAGDAAAQTIASSDLCDALLVSLYQSGFISLRSELVNDAFKSVAMLGEDATAILGVYVTDFGRQELLMGLSSSVEDLVEQLPLLIVQDSIFFSIGGLGLGLYIGRIAQQRRVYKGAREAEVRAALNARKEAVARGETPGQPTIETAEDFRKRLEKAEQETPEGFPDLKMPPLSKWFMPRGVGLKVGILALGYVLMALAETPAIAMAGGIAFAVFSSLYMIQGMAALNFLQKKGGAGAVRRRVTLVIALLLFKTLFNILGIIDQLANFRGLREPLNNHFDDGED